MKQARTKMSFIQSIYIFIFSPKNSAELNGQVGEGNHSNRSQAKLGSGPILAVLTISLLRGRGKIGPDPETHKQRNLSHHCLVWFEMYIL